MSRLWQTVLSIWAWLVLVACFLIVWFPLMAVLRLVTAPFRAPELRRRVALDGLLPGLVLAALAGAPLLLGAAGGVAVAAALIAVAARDPRIGPEAGAGVVVTGLVGLGALLALSPDSPQRLEELLFGDPLGVSDSDLIAGAALAGLGGLALYALHRPLAATAFDGASRRCARRPATADPARPGSRSWAAAVGGRAGLGALLSLALIVGARASPCEGARARPGGAVDGPARPREWPAGSWASTGSYHVGTAAGASVALALCLAAAGRGACRSAAALRERGLPLRGGRRVTMIAAPMGGHRHAHQLRDRRAHHHWSLRLMISIRKRSTPTITR